MQKKTEIEDDLRPEYDFSTLPIVARGAKRQSPQRLMVQLEPDVAEAFPDSSSVNAGLRLLMQIRQGSSSPQSE